MACALFPCEYCAHFVGPAWGHDNRGKRGYWKYIIIIITFFFEKRGYFMERKRLQPAYPKMIAKTVKLNPTQSPQRARSGEEPPQRGWWYTSTSGLDKFST